MPFQECSWSTYKFTMEKFKNCALSVIRSETSEPDCNDKEPVVFQEAHNKHLSKRQNIRFLLINDKENGVSTIKHLPLCFAVSKYMTNIPKSLSTFSSFQHFGPGPPKFGAQKNTHTQKPHTYYNAFHGRSSFIDPLLYGLGGEWVDEHMYTLSVCVYALWHTFISFSLKLYPTSKN